MQAVHGRLSLRHLAADVLKASRSVRQFPIQIDHMGHNGCDDLSGDLACVPQIDKLLPHRLNVGKGVRHGFR